MLKKWIATILSISLVIGMAALLHACGKPKNEVTTAAAEKTASEDACRIEHVISDETFKAIKKHYKQNASK